MICPHQVALSFIIKSGDETHFVLVSLLPKSIVNHMSRYDVQIVGSSNILQTALFIGRRSVEKMLSSLHSWVCHLRTCGWISLCGVEFIEVLFLISVWISEIFSCCDSPRIGQYAFCLLVFNII